MLARSLHALLIAAILLVSPGFVSPGAVAGAPAQQSSARFFAETGFRISNDDFWNFFQRRGGLRTFGYPTSREMVFQGFPVQFFQRAVMQRGADGVQTVNLLDDGLLPYTTINGSTFPAADPQIAKEAPAPNDPQYSAKVIEFTKKYAPDTFDGLPVNFFKTFSTTVTYNDAFPNGDGPASLLPLVNLQIWGAPTSKPMRDPKNNNFVYLRFQRGIMHYDDGCKCTQGLLLGDYLKSVITGENLPIDLEAQAADSPLLRQYDKAAAEGVARVAVLGGTNLKERFEKESAGAQASAVPQPSTSATAATPSNTGQGANAAAQSAAQAAGAASSGQTARTPAATSAKAERANSPEYGMNVFLWGHARTTDRDLNKLKEAGFGWHKTLFQWKHIEAQRGQFDWAEADRIVKTSNAAGVKVIARLDFQPDWARPDKVFNGPPANYQDFGNFVYAFAQRYSSSSVHGRVHAVQIWNEQNLNREWGNAPIDEAQAADYVRLLKTGYEAAKGADPAMIVITGGLAQTGTNNNDARPDDVYLQWMYDAGAKAYFDVLGSHGHGYKAPPTISPAEAASSSDWGGHRFFVFRRVEDMREIMVRNNDADKQIWLLEFGWTSDTVHEAYAWHRVTEDQKGEYLVGAYQWAAKNWSPWIGVMTLWTMPDPGWTQDREEYWWAIANPDGTNRPAFDRLVKARKDGTLP